MSPPDPKSTAGILRWEMFLPHYSWERGDRALHREGSAGQRGCVAEVKYVAAGPEKGRVLTAVKEGEEKR